jgi:hypothetical protein
LFEVDGPNKPYAKVIRAQGPWDLIPDSGAALGTVSPTVVNGTVYCSYENGHWNQSYNVLGEISAFETKLIVDVVPPADNGVKPILRDFPSSVDTRKALAAAALQKRPPAMKMAHSPWDQRP